MLYFLVNKQGNTLAGYVRDEQEARDWAEHTQHTGKIMAAGKVIEVYVRGKTEAEANDDWRAEQAAELWAESHMGGGW